MSRTIRTLIGVIALASMAAQAFLPYPERKLKYPHITNWDAADKMPAAWDGWKRRFVASDGSVKGNDPSGTKKTISEGQSYGMLLSVWFGDQATFDKVFGYTESKMWKGSWYSWDGNDPNYAGDADIDICGALIFASALVDSGYWTDNGYKAKAARNLGKLIGNFFTSEGYVNSWPGAGNGILNPSYHMPGWYPIFREFAAANGVANFDWTKAANAAFNLLEAQPNSKYGMARNFSSSSGGTSSGGTSSIGNSDNNTQDMGFDAIRVPFRMALAATWYPDTFPRAVNWCKNVWENATATVGVSYLTPGYYQTSSATLINWDPPKYEHFMTTAIWAGTAIAVQKQSAKALTARNNLIPTVGTSFPGGIGYMKGAEPDSNLSTGPAQNYFAQSIGLLGALVTSGRAWNVWDDLKHKWTPPDTGVHITSALTATPATIEKVPSTGAQAVNKTVITAKIDRSVPWTLTLVGKTSGAVFDTSAVSTDISLNWWSSRRKTGTSTLFTTEQVNVRLVFGGLDTNSSTKDKATITINPSTGVEARTLRGTGAIRWVQGGLNLQDPNLTAGDRVTARVMDLNGRSTLVAESDLKPASVGVLLDLVPAHATGVRILELTDRATQVRRQYVLSPNP